MRRLWERIPPLVRGLGLVAIVAAVVIVLSLESVLATVGGLVRIAFFLAVAFFLFLLWRDRRGDLEAWSDWNRKAFYAAIVLAVVDVGMLIGLRPSGPDALAFFLVLAACAWVGFRVWRAEHSY
jgi:quinol-cytochrome oxidoreductase complex cytochrome b subunit